jgi:hypothetical protein
MHPGASEDAWRLGLACVGAADLKRAVHGVWAVADTDREHRAHACLPGTSEQGVAVFVVTLAVEVCVGID